MLGPDRAQILANVFLLRECIRGTSNNSAFRFAPSNFSPTEHVERNALLHECNRCNRCMYYLK